MKRTGCITVLGGALVATSCAAPPNAGPSAVQQAGGQCFLAGEVNSFAPSQDYIDVRVGASRYFRLTVAAGCPDIDWSAKIGVRAIGGGSWICQGHDAELIVPLPSGTQQCQISAVTPITKEQYLAGQHH